MKPFGLGVTGAGILACLFAGFFALEASRADNVSAGLGALAFAVAAIGLIVAGGILLRNSR